jgi:hypothetical protein
MLRIVSACLSALLYTMHSFSLHRIYTKLQTDARMYLADGSTLKLPRFPDTCGCGDANSNLGDWRQPVMTSLKYAYGDYVKTPWIALPHGTNHLVRLRLLYSLRANWLKYCPLILPMHRPKHTCYQNIIICMP